MQHPAIRYGLLGALAVAVYFVLLYVSKPDNFLNPALIWASMAVYLFFMYTASAEDCAKYGVNRDFREIVRAPFTVFLLINLGYWIFYYALHLYDPSLISMEMAIKKSFLQAELSTGPGDPDKANQIRAQITELDKLIAAPGVQPLGPVFLRMCTGAIGGFVLAAVVALFMRLKQEK